MTRSCSHCNTNGDNHRTCSTRGGGVRLFGVRLTEGSAFIKKSASMGNLLHHSASLDSLDGYHSDDLDRGCSARRRPRRKKGVPWTEDEHMQFLLGLEKLGRGNWRIISRNYVRSRTPAQVASHAQKYFLRQSNANGSAKKKRPSVFDLEPKMLEEFSIRSPEVSANNGNLMLSSSQADDKKASLLSLDLSLKPAFTPFPFQLWPPNANSVEDYGSGTSVSIVREEPMKELKGMSLLTLGKT